ncbi:MAG: YtxH domain-containing protein [Flavobacteriales bacterium]|nr:YtxH domain-containing protein [Flavobacteriales bacterium]
MTNESKTGIFGFLAGAAIGATLGILFAPRSGKETRERIARGVKDARSDVDDFIDQAREEWTKAKGKATNAATMTKDEVNDFVKFLFEEGQDLKERLKKDVKGSAEDVADRARKAAENVKHSAN